MKKNKNANILPHKSLLYKPSRKKYIATCFLFLLGVSFLLSTPLVNNLIQDEIDQAIEEQITVPDPDDEDYDEWVSSKESSIPAYTSFYMWNLTNPEEYLEGEKPILAEVGPFVFRVYETKYDVAFSEDKELVSYNKYNTYEFKEGHSSPLRLNDKITNINPGYLGVLDIANTEDNITETGTSTVLSEVHKMFDEIFNEEKETLLNDEALETLISDQIDPGNYSMLEDSGLLEVVKDYIRETVPASDEIFVSEWNVGTPLIDVPNHRLFENTTENLKMVTPIVYKEILETFNQKLSDTVAPSNNDFWNDIYSTIREALVDYILEVDDRLNVNRDDNRAQISNAANEIKDRIKDAVNREGFATEAFHYWWGEGRFPTMDPQDFENIHMTLYWGVRPFQRTVYDEDLPPEEITAQVQEAGDDVLSGIQLEGRPTMTEISLTDIDTNGMSYNNYIFENLWDETDSYSLNGGDFSLWIQALEGNSQSRQNLLNTYFGGNREDDLELVLDWIEHSTNIWTEYRVFPEFYELNQQFEPLIHQSVYDALDEAVYDIDIDRIYLENRTGINYGAENDLYCGVSTSHSTAKALWNQNNKYSLTSDGVLKWFLAASGDQQIKETLKLEFGLDDSEINMICSWLDTSKKSWINNILFEVINDLNSGLITTRTVEEWLFTAVDGFIKDIDPELANVNIFSNCTTDSEARKIGTDRFTIKTGKGNYKESKEFVSYNGKEKYLIWAKPVPVSGTDGTQFAPGISKHDDLDICISDLKRPAEFKFRKKTDIYGINLFRFNFKEDVFEPNPTFFMDTKGLLNMYPEYGIPCYLSHPHLLYADESLKNDTIGMHPNTEKHETYIDVEPITGMTMRARQRIQINFRATPTDKWYPNNTEVIIPILWFDKEAEITEEKANEFKESLYTALKLKKLIITSTMAIGTILSIAAMILFSYQINKLKKVKARRLSLKYWINSYDIKKKKEH
ncbi:MAG: hypothetical protein GF353_17440 [Candidatus Lokiarchaeota archaeon]|nr:hypothetical protein [Candidatus Lokiarchaeota archaeon]